MFNRSADRSTVEDPRRTATPTMPTTSLRDAVAVPVQGGLGTPTLPSSQQIPSASSAEESLIAADDSIEGTIRTKRGVRIMGTVKGAVESAQYVHIEENSKVDADVSADEVIIAGQYSGKLTCRQRLEIRATGRVSGQIETVKLMLHEGGYFDGELHMQKPSTESARGSALSGARGRESSDPRGSSSLGGSSALGGSSSSSAASSASSTDTSLADRADDSGS